MMLPNGWKKIKLGEICNKIGSGSTPKGGRDVYLNAGIPIIRSQNVLNGFLDLNDVAFISDEQHSKMKGTWVHPNDILLNITGASIGRSCVVPATVKTANVNQHVCIIRLKECADACYVCNLILSKDVQKQIELLSVGGGRQGLNFQQIASFSFLLPPLEEQKKIAATLSVWDSTIEKMEKLIEAKESGHAVLMNEMLKNSKTWDCTCLSDIATIKKGKQLNAVDMISDGAYYVMNGGITPSGNTDDWNTAENTISISEGGNSCGFVAFNKEKFWAGGHCYTLIDLNENISVRFLFHYLKNMEKEIMAMRVGSGLPNIQKDSISDIKVFYPSKKGQERISGVLDDSLSEIALLKQQLENYKKQKQGLMQKLLTGQWRVK